MRNIHGQPIALVCTEAPMRCGSSISVKRLCCSIVVTPMQQSTAAASSSLGLTHTHTHTNISYAYTQRCGVERPLHSRHTLCVVVVVVVVVVAVAMKKWRACECAHAHTRVVDTFLLVSARARTRTHQWNIIPIWAHVSPEITTRLR